MFKPSSNRYNNRSQKALDLSFQNANIGQQALFFLRPKMRTKIDHSTKIVKSSASLTLSVKRGRC